MIMLREVQPSTCTTPSPKPSLCLAAPAVPTCILLSRKEPHNDPAVPSEVSFYWENCPAHESWPNPILLFHHHITTAEAMALTQTTLEASLPLVARGKVRDVYSISDDSLLFVATDRISAYDVVMSNVSPIILLNLTPVHKEEIRGENY